MNKPKKLPKFKNIEEEAEFWDTHNLFDYATGQKINLIYDPDKPKEETIIVRVQREIKNTLANLAKSQGISPSTLVRMWMIEKLNGKCYNNR